MKLAFNIKTSRIIENHPGTSDIRALSQSFIKVEL